MYATVLAAFLQSTTYAPAPQAAVYAWCADSSDSLTRADACAVLYCAGEWRDCDKDYCGSDAECMALFGGEY